MADALVAIDPGSANLRILLAGRSGIYEYNGVSNDWTLRNTGRAAGCLRPPPKAFTFSMIPNRNQSLIRSNPDLTPPADFAIFRLMKALIQTGSSGRAPAPPEKRFLISQRR